MKGDRTVVSEIYFHVNKDDGYDFLVGVCGDTKISFGHKEPFSPMGVHENGNVWRGFGKDAIHIGKYDEMFVYQIQDGKRKAIGAYRDGHIYLWKQSGYIDIGHYTCEPIAAAAALLFYDDYSQYLRNWLTTPRFEPLDPPFRTYPTDEQIRKAVDQMYK